MKLQLINAIMLGALLISSAFAQSNEKIRVGFFIKCNHFDHIYATASGETLVLNNVVEGLTRYNKKGEVVPGAAKSWDISDDGKVYTFHLRDNLRWSDGEKLTAYDFANTFERIHDPSYNTMSKPNYLASFILNSQAIFKGDKPISSLGFKVLDEKTLSITLESAIPFFPIILAYSAFAPSPVHVISQHGNAWVDPEHIVSSGPYAFTAMSDKKIKLSKNPYYYDADQVYFDQVELVYFDTRNIASHHLLMGKVDMVQDYRELDMRKLSPILREKIYSVPRRDNMTAYMVLNQNDSAFKDKRLGQALSMSIDRHYMGEALGNNKEAYSFATPSLRSQWKIVKPAWAKDSLSQRIEKAKVLMRELGYGSDNHLKLKVKVHNRSQFDLLGSSLKTSWANIWVDMRLITQPPKKHYQDIRARQFQAASAGWSADYDDPLSFLALYHSLSEKNYADWKNPAYDEKLDELNKKNHSIMERFAIYRDMEAIILDYVPIIPLYYGASYFLINKSVLIDYPESTLPVLIPYLKRLPR